MFAWMHFSFEILKMMNRGFGNSQTCDNCLSYKSCWGLTEIVAADASAPVLPCFPNIPKASLLF